MSPRLAGVAALSLIVAGLGVWGSKSLLLVRDVRREITREQHDIERLRERSRSLVQEVTRLRTDAAYLEKVAREEQGLARPGETILKFPSDKKK
ncbi:MAG: FtsB family cell division protein [Candidatus Rokuibacteriota bacterium]